jgi:DNA-directed RNA polymerase subunit RPC12/RpoP
MIPETSNQVNAKNPYTEPTVTTAVMPLAESWSEIHCPACSKLGYPVPRFLFKYSGEVIASNTNLYIVCDRCGSSILFNFKTHLFVVEKMGRVYKRRQTAAFE